MTYVPEKTAIRLTNKTKDAFRKMRYTNRIKFKKINNEWYYDFETVFRLAQFKTVPVLVRDERTIWADLQNVRDRIGQLPSFMVWQPSKVIYVPPSLVQRINDRYPGDIV